VAEPKPDAPRPFDAKMLEHLIGLMTKHDLSEIDLSEGEQRIRLRKGFAPPAGAFVPPPVAYALGSPNPTPAAPAPGTPGTAEPPKPTKKYHEIKSPMVGTYYSKSSPDKPDYVSVGSKVKPDTVVCKLEAMKIFNDLTADVAGTVAEVCVKNGQPVEFGTVLFRVEPA
jgi:acetyl-CoA carboxylase biotin carboxyl carrier protein